MKLDLSIIIPTYNERDNIVKVINEIYGVLEPISIRYEVLFVDDNSPDRTWEVLQELSEKDPKIQTLRRFREKGLSSAVYQGMEFAKGKYFLVMDADLQHDPKIIPEMLKQIQTCDLVIASRNHSKGSYGNFSKLRKFLSHLANSFAIKLLHCSVSDPMSGFFLIRREVFYENATKLNPRGFKILLEFLAKCKGLTIQEVGYTFRNRAKGKSKLGFETIEAYILAILEIALGNFFSVLFTRYATIGFLGMIINLLGQWVGNLFLNSEHMHDPNNYFLPSLAVTFGFILSVIHNFLWNYFWTFRKYKENQFQLLEKFFLFSAISLFGFLIQISVWRYTYFLLSQVYSWKYLTYFSNFLGILSATAWNYFLNKNFTWQAN
jgi:dolichol-phosphate mannosyltransferase